MESQDFDENDNLPITQWIPKHTGEEEDTNSNLLLRKQFSRNAGDIRMVNFSPIYDFIRRRESLQMWRLYTK